MLFPREIYIWRNTFLCVKKSKSKHDPLGVAILVLVTIFLAWNLASYLSGFSIANTLLPVNEENSNSKTVDTTSLQVIGYPEEKTYLVGNGNDVDFGYLSLVVPNTDAIVSITLTQDGKERLLDFKTESLNERTIIELYILQPLSIGMEDGFHRFDFRVETTHNKYEKKLRIDTDTKSPTFSIKKDRVVVTDEHPINELSLYLLSMNGKENPIQLNTIHPTSSTAEIELEKTNSLVIPGTFRLIIAEDIYHNRELVTLDDLRSTRDVLDEYRGNRFSQTPTPTSTFSDGGTGVFSNLYYAHNTNDPSEFPLAEWNAPSKKSNLLNMVNGGITFLQNAGAGHPYSPPKITPATDGQMKFISPSQLSEFGLKLMDAKFPTGQGNYTIKKIVVLDFTDPAVEKPFKDK